MCKCNDIIKYLENKDGGYINPKTMDKLLQMLYDNNPKGFDSIKKRFMKQNKNDLIKQLHEQLQGHCNVFRFFACMYVCDLSQRKVSQIIHTANYGCTDKDGIAIKSLFF